MSFSCEKNGELGYSDIGACARALHMRCRQKLSPAFERTGIWNAGTKIFILKSRFLFFVFYFVLMTANLCNDVGNIIVTLLLFYEFQL